MSDVDDRMRRGINPFLATGSDIEYWDSNTEQLFRTRLLPNLRKTATWGYAFDDGREIDNHLFMFHGYRPVTQAGKGEQ